MALTTGGVMLAKVNTCYVFFLLLCALASPPPPLCRCCHLACLCFDLHTLPCWSPVELMGVSLCLVGRTTFWVGHTANSHWYQLTYVSVYAFMLFSPFISPSPSSPPALPINLFSMSLPPLLFCTQICHYHPSRFHICVNIWHLLFSFWLTSLCIIGSRFIQPSITGSNMFLLMAE